MSKKLHKTRPCFLQRSPGPSYTRLSHQKPHSNAERTFTAGHLPASTFSHSQPRSPSIQLCRGTRLAEKRQALHAHPTKHTPPLPTAPSTRYKKPTHIFASPSPATAQALARGAQYLLPVYARPDFVLSHGKGSYVWDTEGRKYLDFSAGIAVNALGHADEEYVQVRRVVYGARPFPVQNGVMLPCRLALPITLSKATSVLISHSHIDRH